MSKIDATVLKDGQLAVATLEQSGTLISGASAIDTTCLVQTEDGVQQCVKTFPLGEGGGGGGTSDYSDLSNKPQINGTTLSGNKSSSDLGVVDTSLSNLTDAGKIQAAHLAMPSDVYEDLSASSEMFVTAPADGYIYASAGTSVQLIVLQSDAPNDDGQYRVLELISPSTGRATLPIRKGQKASIELFGTINRVRFTYAQGSESEHTPQP